jgi:tetratricopeptide (TPR) repeat protein
MVAYTLYLKGRHCWNERSKDSLTKAVKYFEEAVERDPMFALAYSGQADSYCVLTDHGYLPANEGYAKAKNAAKKALQLDDALAEAHTSLGGVLFHEWDWLGTEAEFTKALVANPNYATAHQWYSLCLAALGRLEEAIEQAKIAEELDPLSAIIHACLGGHFYAARKYDASIEEFNKALELEPNFAPAYGQRYYVYLMKSMFNEALADLRQWLPGLSPSMATIMESQHQCYVYAVSGMTEEAKLIIRECEEKVARERDEALDRGVIANFIVIHFKLGNKNRAFEWLAKFFEMRMLTSSEVKCDPFFAEITSDPRFEELSRKTLRSLEAT